MHLTSLAVLDQQAVRNLPRRGPSNHDLGFPPEPTDFFQFLSCNVSLPSCRFRPGAERIGQRLEGERQPPQRTLMSAMVTDHAGFTSCISVVQLSAGVVAVTVMY